MNHSNVIAFPTRTLKYQIAPVVTSSVTKLPQATKRLANHKLSIGEIWEALMQDRLTVHYQPQYDMKTGKTIAVEALVRLIDLGGSLIYPDRFIEVVEESDLIIPLGRAVIEQACADLAAIRAKDSSIKRMAVNLSARQIEADAGLLNFIDDTLSRNGLGYQDLELEITERQNLATDSDSVQILHTLAERGARIVIDDFGIGYSSVVYLTQLPVSAFKLDRELITPLPQDKAMQAVVRNLLRLAAELNIDVVGEGIETTEQHGFLRQAECHIGQGFGFARPMRLEALLDFVQAESSAQLSG